MAPAVRFQFRCSGADVTGDAGLKDPAAAELRARLIHGDSSITPRLRRPRAKPVCRSVVSPAAAPFPTRRRGRRQTARRADAARMLGVRPCRPNGQGKAKTFKDRSLRPPPLCIGGGLCNKSRGSPTSDPIPARAYGLKPIYMGRAVKQQRGDLCGGGGARKPFSLAIYHRKIQSAAVASINVRSAAAQRPLHCKEEPHKQNQGQRVPGIALLVS